MTDLLKQEYERAIKEYPPELWAKMHRADMLAALQREVNEVARALWCEDMDGPHGLLIESAHVQIVARRIVEECQRRGGSE